MNKITFYIALVFSLTFHEFAHALSAKWQGDTTAEDMGRLTLNPIAHIDPLGTVIFPLIAAFTGVPLIGWAKPVPVNLNNFRSKKWGDGIVAFAGPASNLLLCFFSLVLILVHSLFFAEIITPTHALFPLINLATALAIVNSILAFFNLIPLPPLDGGSVFGVFLPRDMYEKYYRLVAPYGMFILFAMMFSNGFQWIYKAATLYMDISQSIILKSLGTLHGMFL